MPDIEEFLAPISEDAPAGQDVRYDIVYDDIREAREEEPPLPQGDWQRERKVADFKLVRKLATEVLTTRSKDLQIAAWLTEAWIDQEGFAGLRSGADLIRELLERFWDDVHPEIDDGDLEFRVAPLEWLGGYLDPRIRAVPLNPAGHDFLTYDHALKSIKYEDEVQESEKKKERAEAIELGAVSPEAFDAAVDSAPKSWYKALVGDIEGAVASLDALEALTDDRFGEVRPSYASLRKVLAEVKRIADRLLARKLEQDPDPVQTEPSSSEVAAPAMAESGEGGVPLEPTSKGDAGNRIAAAARFLRGADPLDPAPYLMVRGLRWGELRRVRGEVDPRLLAAPPTRTRTHLKGLLLDGKWGQLLEAAEDVMATPYGRGWLDLQRYVFTALDGLGSEYDAVEGSLRSALRGLLIDLPDLPDRTLMDDTPTANRETRTWLAEEGLLGPLTDEEQARLEVDTALTVVTGRDVSERALERVRAGQPQKAIELLMRAADEAGSPRGRALRRAEAAGIMVDHGLAQVALPILRDVMSRIETHKLEEWEDSETVAIPMALLYRCLERTGGDASEREALYLRVCRLDPMQAILFSTEAGAEDSDSGGADDGSAGGDESAEA